jgi:hypothetical protein
MTSKSFGIEIQPRMDREYSWAYPPRKACSLSLRRLFDAIQSGIFRSVKRN